jgi:two-component system, NtrC family, sensor kinase
MKKLFILLASLWLFTNKTSGQTNLPPVYEISSDTAISTVIPDGYWKMLEDKEGKLTLQDVLKLPVADKFHFNQSKDKQFNFGIHTYWFCFRLKNVMNRDAEIGLGFNSFPNQGNEQSTVYLAWDGQWSEYENGIFAPRMKLNGLALNNFVHVTMKPGEEVTVYNREYNSYLFPFTSGNYSIGFSNAKKILEQNYVQDESLLINAVNDSILFGILLFAVAFNFFFFLIVKERLYLYFAVYVLNLGIGRMPTETYFVFLRESRILWIWLYAIVYEITFFFLVLFIRSLLNTRTLLPRWDRFLNRLNYANLIVGLLSYLIPYLFPSAHEPEPYRIINIITLGTGIALMGCILLTFFIVLKRYENANKTLTFFILPVLCVWAPGWAISTLYETFGVVFFSISFTRWLDNWWNYIESVCLCWLVLSYSWVLLQRFRNLQNRIAQQEIERQKEKTVLIEQKKIELEKKVEERTAELKLSFENLQSTQHQLIQSEKMASLGELTAGIAHEIQNPLNFVNNFSEVNRELIDEASQAIVAGNIHEAIELLSSLKINEEKINIHGQRADSIVKGMLLHSRSSSGQKEPIDVNALADEYLRLSYHGLRAKDKSFNATIQTDFDSSIGKIGIVPQDMGRVLLNLYNNAFYAVWEKANLRLSGYIPTVSVTTKREGDYVRIVVSDNGTGVPQKVIDKIFQPFFTTKPTGQGTGLGLSMSYDIIKSHGGELTVESMEGEGAKFIIRVPVY